MVEIVLITYVKLRYVCTYPSILKVLSETETSWALQSRTVSAWRWQPPTHIGGSPGILRRVLGLDCADTVLMCQVRVQLIISLFKNVTISETVTIVSVKFTFVLQSIEISLFASNFPNVPNIVWTIFK